MAWHLEGNVIVLEKVKSIFIKITIDSLRLTVTLRGQSHEKENILKRLNFGA